ncbi:MAG: TRAP transporter large permease [Hyphomicrobiaceae bacterium]
MTATDPLILGAGGFLALLLLLALRVPIAVALAAIGSFGFIAMAGLAPYLAFVKGGVFEVASNYSFSVIPLFLLMGNLAAGSGLARRLFEGMNALVGHRSGGLAMAAVGSCAAFGTICGSSLATAATMARVALPQMRRLGYSGALSTGSLAAGGALGILVPPSVPLVVYALLTEQNVAKLFLAAFLPAALAILGFFVAIRVTVALDPASAPRAPRGTARSRLAAVADIWPVVAIFLVVFVGMNGDFFFGRSLFSPTEGAAIGALSTGIAAATAGRMRLKGLIFALEQTALQSAMIFLILIGAEIYNAFLARTRLPDEIAAVIVGAGIAPVLVVVAIVALYILLGCLMDSLSMILLTVPVFFPVVMGLDFGLGREETAIWFGILVLIVVELGLIHPPVGLNIYVIQGFARDVTMAETMRGVVPFLLAEFVRVALIIAFPAIALALIR